MSKPIQTRRLAFGLTLLTAGASAWAQDARDVRPVAGAPVFGTCGSHDLQPAQVVDAGPAGARGAFQINIDYTGSGFSVPQQIVFDAAIVMWEDVITANGGSGTFTITNPSLTVLGGTTIGLADTYTQDTNGIPVSARIRMDSTTTWFVDPTPFDNSEYLPSATLPFEYTGGTDDAANLDFLSVALHEIGHAVGWAVSFTRFNALTTNGPGSLRTFDANNFPVTLVAATAGTHPDPATHPGELMMPAINGGTRRLISYFPTMTGPQRAYDYTIPLLTFVRSNYVGTESGIARQPYNTFAEGLTNASSGDVIIIRGGAYSVTVPYVSPNKALTVWPVLGTVTVSN